MTATGARPAIRATGLRKSYGDKVVLDGVDLAVPEGTIFALLGPNGAGKTTVVKILSTLISADGGEIRIGGHDLAPDPQAVRAAIGVTGQFSAVDDLITGEENMLLMADLHHLAQRGAAGAWPSCWSASTWSRRRRSPSPPTPAGMKRRLDIAMTLVGDPRIIFLDEPTTGLDPRVPAQHVADHPRAGRRRRHRLPHHAVPRGGRSSSPTASPCSTTGSSSPREHRGAEAADPRWTRAAALRRSGRVSSPPPSRSTRSPRTRSRCRCRSPATAASASCAPSSTGWTRPASRRTN